MTHIHEADPAQAFDGYFPMLGEALDTVARENAIRSLIDEVGKLGVEQEGLLQARRWLQQCDDAIARLATRPPASADHQLAIERLIDSLEETHDLLEDYCKRASSQLRRKGRP